MATVFGLFTSPGRKSGVSSSHDRLGAVAGQVGQRGRRGTIARLVGSGEVAVGDGLSPL